MKIALIKLFNFSKIFFLSFLGIILLPIILFIYLFENTDQ